MKYFFVCSELNTHQCHKFLTSFLVNGMHWKYTRDETLYENRPISCIHLNLLSSLDFIQTETFKWKYFGWLLMLCCTSAHIWTCDGNFLNGLMQDTSLYIVIRRVRLMHYCYNPLYDRPLQYRVRRQENNLQGVPRKTGPAHLFLTSEWGRFYVGTLYFLLMRCNLWHRSRGTTIL
jgi:hypothetical protein